MAQVLPISPWPRPPFSDPQPNHSNHDLWSTLSVAPRAGRVTVRAAALQPADADALLAMLGRCSASTMYRRFHGLTDGRAHAVEVLRGGPEQDAYGAWIGDRCIGLASLALDSDASTHIGVLVEDGWQRRGAGTALMVTLVHRARERRLSSLVADVLAGNQFILSLLARVGPITTAVVPGGYRIRISLTGEDTVG